MEFFVCPCPAAGRVILNDQDQGPNKNSSGKLLTKQCNSGPHTVSLRCTEGRTCTPAQVTVVIADTDPISPQEVAFQCG